MLIDRIASDQVLEQAFGWMCEKRAHHHFNSDVWQVRRWWDEKKSRRPQQLRDGTYRYRELRVFWAEDQRVEYWSSLDALVLKAMAIGLTEHLHPNLSPLLLVGIWKTSLSPVVGSPCRITKP
jgi:hypothetical protein